MLILKKREREKASIPGMLYSLDALKYYSFNILLFWLISSGIMFYKYIKFGVEGIGKMLTIIKQRLEKFYAF